MGNAVNGDSPFLHRFKKRGLGLAGSSVDFVRKKKVSHNRAGFIAEFSLLPFINGKTYYIRRHGIGSELHPFAFKSEDF